MARTGYGKHATQVDTSTYPDDPSVPIGSDEWNAEPSDSGMLGFNAETIASATTITPSNTVLNVSGSTNISTIAQGNTNEYDLLYIFTSGTATLEHNTGNLQLISGANKDLSTTVPTILIRKGTDWVEYGGGGNVTGTVMSGHIIPDANDTYDIGSAEYKIRDMYVSDNSLWVGDDHKVDVQGGKMKFKKRKKNNVPSAITNAGGDSAGALTSSGKGSLTLMTLNDWVQYGRSLGGALANAKPNDIYGSEVADDWDADDATIPQKGTAGKILGYNASTGVIEEQDAPAGGAEAGSGVQPVSTTIGDYTTPTSATVSSTKATTIDGTTTYSDDTDYFKQWSSVSGFKTFPNSFSGAKIYNLTVRVARDNSSNNNTHVIDIYSSATVLRETSSTWSMSGTWQSAGNTAGYTNRTGTFSGTLVVNAGDKFRIRKISGSATNNYHKGLQSNMTYTASIDNATAYTNTYAYDDDLTNMWASTSETNPSISAGLSASGNMSQLAIYLDSDTTETEIQIQTSSDNSTWTTKRTITVSNLTTGAWNYIRLNNTLGQYIRVRGSSGSAVTLAINEIKILTATDSEVMIDHGHVTIDSTDTSLGLDGT